MKNVWDSTVEAFNNAKTTIVTKMKDNSQKNPSETDRFKILFNQIHELKRSAKESGAKIQVVRINIINISSAVEDISNNFLQVLNSEESEKMVQGSKKFTESMKRLSNTLLPIYAEQPYYDVVHEIKQSMPLFKKASDILDRISIQKIAMKAQDAIPDKKITELKENMEENLVQLESVYNELVAKVQEVNGMLHEAHKKSFAALTFYYKQFLDISFESGVIQNE